MWGETLQNPIKLPSTNIWRETLQTPIKQPNTYKWGETLQTPTSGDRQPKAKVHWDFKLLDHKFNPIKPKEGSILMSQERIKDVLNSILEGQERINEKLAQISWIANFALQVSLANQSMLSTLCKDNSPEPEEIPHFQFLKKRVRDFNRLSFQLSSPINKNMFMDSIPKEVVPYHISNGAIKPSTGNCRRWRKFSKLHMTLGEALEKLQAKGLLKPLDPKPIPHPVPKRYKS